MVTWFHPSFQRRSSSFEMGASILAWSNVFHWFFPGIGRDWWNIFAHLIQLQNWCSLISWDISSFYKSISTGYVLIYITYIYILVKMMLVDLLLFLKMWDLPALRERLLCRGEEFRNSLKARPLALRCRGARKWGAAGEGCWNKRCFTLDLPPYVTVANQGCQFGANISRQTTSDSLSRPPF